MIVIIFFILISTYFLISIIRVLLTLSYWKNNKLGDLSSNFKKEKYTILQPIVSGDPFLKRDLEENITGNESMGFVWIVDEYDFEAIEITNEIAKNFSGDIKIVIAGPIPTGVNAKVYKQNLGLEYAREIVIAIDDDTVVPMNDLGKIHDLVDSNHYILTGIPYYRNYSTFYSKMVTAFVNNNSIFTYPVMAKLKKLNTVNGMFYIIGKNTINKTNLYSEIMEKLCDEYEISKVMKANNIKVKLIPIPCKVGTTVKTSSHYISIMKRWMIFANTYAKENISLSTGFLLLLPQILPITLLIISFFCGFKFVILFLILHFIKSLFYKLIRKKLLSNRENIWTIFYGMAAEYIQPIHYMNALFFSTKLLWRKNFFNIDKNSKIE